MKSHDGDILNWHWHVCFAGQDYIMHVHVYISVCVIE